MTDLPDEELARLEALTNSSMDHVPVSIGRARHGHDGPLTAMLIDAQGAAVADLLSNPDDLIPFDQLVVGAVNAVRDLVTEVRRRRAEERIPRQRSAR